ncbi:MAG TPA: hypothetical protein VGV38_00830 [Pyrinomonadaceae bacterium]|nr:hypothetical protein [Pyrinomonadaceae bacterium]
MERVPRQHSNRHLRRERDRRAVVRQAVLLVCGFALAFGFAYAARQQFSAVRLGYQSEALRRERERLLAEQKRLLNELETERSPARLEAEARQIGMQPARSAQLGVAAPPPAEARETGSRTFVGSAAATTLRR